MVGAMVCHVIRFRWHNAIQLPGEGFVKRPLLGLVFAPDATCPHDIDLKFSASIICGLVLYVAVLSCCMLGVCNIYETHLLWSMWLYVALHYTYHTRYLGSLSFRDHPCVISSRFANPIFPQGHGPGAETQWHHGHEGLDTFHVKLPHRINLKSTAFSPFRIAEPR